VARPLWLTKLLVRTRLARFVPSIRQLADGGTGHLKYYSDAVLGAPVEELLDPAFVPEVPGSDVIDLNQPAPRFESPVGTGRAADRTGRPPAWGTPELRNAIADLYVRRDGREVDPDHDVFVTHGATAGYAAFLSAFVNPGDRVALFDPCSPLFALGARSRRASVKWVPTWNEDGRCRFLAAEFERVVKRSKVLVLSDPCNPTGACFSQEDLEHVAWIAAGYDVLIFADESFTRFRYDGRTRSLAVMPGADVRTVTAGSVSQGYGLGSVRVGWVAGPRHLVKACALTASLSAPYVPTVCQSVAARAVAESDEAFEPTRGQFEGKRRYVIDRLKACGLEPDWPSGSYFAWVPVAPLGVDGRSFAERLLREEKVLVGPGCAFGPGGAGHVRVSFAADDGRLREGLGRLAAFVERLKNPNAPAPEVPAEPPAEVGEPAFSRV
jgi:aspartate/methionine/tyrosine aminotransferase